jgi:hypothetical protein
MWGFRPWAAAQVMEVPPFLCRYQEERFEW